MEYHNSLLISCVGAYDDSGIGTGGLVCVHNGEAVIIDKMDCTGLYQTDDMIYRFIRSMQAIIGYDENGIRYFLRLPMTKDVHDILLVDGTIVCVCTGHNEICWFDPLGRLIKRWQAKGERDAWHLNCLYYADGRLYVSAFGEFERHRGWSGRCSNTGFILDMDANEKVLSGLSGPHSPRYIDGRWVVCESHIGSLTVKNKHGNIERIRLNGFTRGLAYDNTYLYVGESANRKAAVVRDFSFVRMVDRDSFETIHRIRIPFPEIYEILLISPSITESMISRKEKFVFDFSDYRIKALENQVERGFEEIERLRGAVGRRLLSTLKRVVTRIIPIK